jgi:UPF0755 protein
MLSVMLRRLCVMAVILPLGLYLGFIVLNTYLDSPLSLQENKRIEVLPGTSLTHLSHQLANDGVLLYPQVFTLFARITEQTGIRAGEYQLDKGITHRELLVLLNSGKVIQYQLTFPEGLNFREWLSLLAQQPKLAQKLSGLTVKELLEQLSLDIEHPEGWFFPDTYRYSVGDSDADILRQAHARMRQVLAEEWPHRAADLPLASPYEALTLASIVEKETGVGSERAQIAGVFVRRLIKGMRLQTDPTVIYGLGEKYQGNITRDHLRQSTAYNTYLIKGLPPTPIAMPGREAIYAALHPAEGEALYFVAKGDGSHYFSNTLAEHLNAVRKYQLQRRSNYRSSPQN